jgi:hypothetical protein
VLLIHQENQHSVLVGVCFICNLSFFLLEFLDMDQGKIADMVELGILESFHLKRQVVISAAEAAEMVLRIDNIIRAPPRPRQRDMRHH